MAQVAAMLARRRAYLPLLDGPRLTRPDADAEVLRRNNAAARVQPRDIILAGLPAATCELFAKHFPAKKTRRIATIDDLPLPKGGSHLDGKMLRWGTSNIGLGLLRALRSRMPIVFEESASAPRDAVSSLSGHLVVCEDGHLMAQVLAANYAFALDAGMCLIPSLPDDEADRLLERFYSVHQNRAHSPTSLLKRLKRELREYAGALPLVPGGSVTFVCKEIPWGFAFPELPSSHLFSYPDLGIAMINGVVAEQPGTPGIQVAGIIDPGSVDSREIADAVDRLTEGGVVALGIRSKRATVHRAAQMVAEFPYDLLLISTHCGDADGWRWTYEFVDSEGIARVLVTEIAIGVQVVPGQHDLHVTEFHRFVSLDGVDWTDPDKKSRLYVGQAIRDWEKFNSDGRRLDPVKKEEITRVPGSMALRMADNNYIALPQALAGGGSPVVISNACCSWHRLAGTFMFGNARVYVGTLFDVLDAEAQGVIERLFGRYWNKPLSVALWRAQNDIASDGIRRPYVMVGCHFQRLRSEHGEGLRTVVSRLRGSIAYFEGRLTDDGGLSDRSRRQIEANVIYLKEQLASLDRWLAGRQKG
jgi:hypothetical protein